MVIGMKIIGMIIGMTAMNSDTIFTRDEKGGSKANRLGHLFALWRVVLITFPLTFEPHYELGQLIVFVN